MIQPSHPFIHEKGTENRDGYLIYGRFVNHKTNEWIQSNLSLTLEEIR